jgi:hypothetical protein
VQLPDEARSNIASQGRTTEAALMAKREKFCVVFNSTAKGKSNHVVECVAGKVKAKKVARDHNRSIGMGGFYSVVRQSTVSRFV